MDATVNPAIHMRNANVEVDDRLTVIINFFKLHDLPNNIQIIIQKNLNEFVDIDNSETPLDIIKEVLDNKTYRARKIKGAISNLLQNKTMSDYFKQLSKENQDLTYHAIASFNEFQKSNQNSSMLNQNKKSVWKGGSGHRIKIKTRRGRVTNKPRKTDVTRLGRKKRTTMRKTLQKGGDMGFSTAVMIVIGVCSFIMACLQASNDRKKQN